MPSDCFVDIRGEDLFKTPTRGALYLDMSRSIFLEYDITAIEDFWLPR